VVRAAPNVKIATIRRVLCPTFCFTALENPDPGKRMIARSGVLAISFGDAGSYPPLALP
jgi:hypothetical protein